MPLPISRFFVPAALAIAGALYAVATPAQARGDELASLINAWRAAPGACNGRPAAPAPPLTPHAALSRVHVGAGAFLESALEGAGYAAERVGAITVTGPQDAAAALEAIRQPYCATLLDPAFSAVGTSRTGNAWQIVLARPLLVASLPGWEDAGQQILALVNAARAAPRACGTQAFGPAGPVAWNGALAQAALAHSGDMAANHYFNHQERDGSTAAERASRAGYRWLRVGENIASGQRSPEEAVAGWLDSPGHCANLMNPAFTEMGAAYAINPQNRKRTAYWTQVFGTPR